MSLYRTKVSFRSADRTGLRRDDLGVGETLSCCRFSLVPSVCDVVSALEKGVDYLPMAKPDAINHSGIRRDCCAPLRCAGCW